MIPASIPDSVCFGPDLNGRFEAGPYFTVMATYGRWSIDIASCLTPEEATELCRAEMQDPTWLPTSYEKGNR